MAEDATLNINVTGLPAFKAAVERITELHQPDGREGEVFYEKEGGPSSECEPSCTYETCSGHDVKLKVCRECGYEHDGDYATFRPWPCPTMQALAELVQP